VRELHNLQNVEERLDCEESGGESGVAADFYQCCTTIMRSHEVTVQDAGGHLRSCLILRSYSAHSYC
jgi:hypothetical protein